MTSQILLLTGMTPDKRIFEGLLPYLPTASVISWIDPGPQESLRDYAVRLAASIPKSDKPIVCGVSFGGVVARELALQLQAKTCVLISSVRNPQQFPPLFRILRFLAGRHCSLILNAIGTLTRAFSARLRTRTSVKLSRFVGDQGPWYRWAAGAVLEWKPDCETESVSVFQIHGDCDTTFPIRYITPDVVIAGGGHLLPLTHVRKIAGMLAELACREKSAKA